MPHSVPAGPPLRPGERRSTSWAGFSGGRTRGPARPLPEVRGGVPPSADVHGGIDDCTSRTRTGLVERPDPPAISARREARGRHVEPRNARLRRVNDTGAAQELDAIVGGAIRRHPDEVRDRARRRRDRSWATRWPSTSARLRPGSRPDNAATAQAARMTVSTRSTRRRKRRRRRAMPRTFAASASRRISSTPASSELLRALRSLSPSCHAGLLRRHDTAPVQRAVPPQSTG